MGNAISIAHLIIVVSLLILFFLSLTLFVRKRPVNSTLSRGELVEISEKLD